MLRDKKEGIVKETQNIKLDSCELYCFTLCDELLMGEKITHAIFISLWAEYFSHTLGSADSALHPQGPLGMCADR